MIDTIRQMHRALARLRSTVAALLVAVMVIVPVADAFLCSFESDAQHATNDHTGSSLQDEAGKGDVPDGSHGACAHNHCHHAAANLFFSAGVLYLGVHVEQPALQDPGRAFGLSEGPMRPPQV